MPYKLRRASRDLQILTVVVLTNPKCPIAVTRLEITLPQIRGLEDVTIGIHRTRVVQPEQPLQRWLAFASRAQKESPPKQLIK